MGLFSRAADHQWSQRHLSHYVDGDLGSRARRRLESHAEDCVDCGRGIRAMRALLRLLPSFADDNVRAPADIFDRVRSDTIRGAGEGGLASPAGDG